MPCSIIVCNYSEELYERIAKEIIDSISAVRIQKNTVNIALPGGRSIAGVLQALSRPCHENVWNDKGINIYLADERISSNHDELNETLLRQQIFGFAPEQLHFNLLTSFDEYNNQGISLDIVILGVGEDGHIASIFPGDSRPILADSTYVTIYNSPKSPSKRISLTYSALRKAAFIYLLFIGDNKRRALDSFSDSETGTAACPAKICLEFHSSVKIFTDICLHK